MSTNCPASGFRTDAPARHSSLRSAGYGYICTVGRFPDGRIGEIFLAHHNSNSAADTNARDSAIVCSIALQCGADIETLRKALTRDAQGRPGGPLGAAVDRLCEGGGMSSE